MSFTCTVDWQRFRDHCDNVASRVHDATGAGMVPVIKGGGYGLGQVTLSNEATRMGADTVAVGTIFEAGPVLEHTRSKVLVLEPFDPRDAAATDAWWQMSQRAESRRLIRTISSQAGLRTLLEGTGPAHIVLEGRTSMWRFGFEERAILDVLNDSMVREALREKRLHIVGLSLHEPIAEPADEAAVPNVTSASAKVREVVRWAGMWQTETEVWKGSAAPAHALFVSHLNDSELAAVASVAPDLQVRARIGTRLWLGDRGAFRVQATVLAVHPLQPETHVGYRQRTGPKHGTLVVVSGGTSHGIGLTAPTPASSVRQRVVSAGTGVLDAAGRAMSPFVWAGKQRWFAEPPHQHHSMIWLPRGVVVPAVGDALTAEVRFTTTTFDHVM
jgi:alanine racemase